ncbi:PfkB family carbohydrate kinase [Microbacterium sp. Mu-80]|uniref:PfkB family carbohydrate kinase n=1 Tax=Microbacterium bandirmense TaxID=3122050 RepID=A0ABU8LH33_9MICO
MPHLPVNGESLGATGVERSPGGKAANQIVAAARLGSPTAFIGTVGHDPGDSDPSQVLRDEGVDVRFLRRDPRNNGFSVILLTPEGDQVIVTDNGPGSEIAVEPTLRALASLAAQILLVQGETDPAATLQVAHEFTGTVIFDPSPAAPFVGADLAFVTVLTPNAGEADTLAGRVGATAADVRIATGAQNVVVTRGGRGAEVSTGDGDYFVPAPEAVVADPSGAGDAFNGAMAGELLRGSNLRGAVELGVRAAAFSVSRYHCIPSFPRAEDLVSLSARGVAGEIERSVG